MPVIAELPTIPFDRALIFTGTAAAIALVLLGLFVAATSQARVAKAGHRILPKFLFTAFLACIAVLAASSFASILMFGHMSGYALLAHIGSAGGFVFLLLAFTYLYLPRGSGAASTDTEHRWWLSRMSAWVMVLAGILTAGTMFLSMLPILGTDGLHQAAEVHRWAGLVVVVSAAFHLLALFCTRLGLR